VVRGDGALGGYRWGLERKKALLVREPGPSYHCAVGLASLEGIANQEKKLPADFMNAAGNWPTEAFLAYARPFVGELQPRYVRLAKHFV
jgi:6-phosphofructokinase 1